MKRTLLARVLALGIGLGTVALLLYWISGTPSAPIGTTNTVQVLSYSSFLSSWGPGPEIAQAFQKEFGIAVEYHDAGDAGLLLKKLELFPADLVVGLDQTMLDSTLMQKTEAYDRAPLTFIYRKGEIEPPTSLNDLLDPKFKGAIALEDPRTSSPGLQFFMWVLDEMGEERGFAYLAKLKGNIHTVAPNWSAAYGLFTKKQAKLAFSYVTSAAYHWIEDKDESYQPAVFAEGHPVQTEYAAVPATCKNCENAEKFMQFLLRPEIQKIIMQKNVMFPVVAEVKNGTPYEKLPALKEREWKNLPDLLKRQPELFERWRRLGL